MVIKGQLTLRQEIQVVLVSSLLVETESKGHFVSVALVAYFI